MSRAISNVFLTVHGVEGEQTPGQAQRRDHGLGGGNLVALFGDRQMAEDNLAVGGKGAQHMGRLAVVEGVEAAAQGLAVDGHRRGEARALDRDIGKAGGMVAEHLLHLLGIETVQDEPHRRIGGSAAERHAKPAVQAIQMGPDEAVDLTIRPCPGQHCQHREQQDRGQRVHLPLAATGIGNLGKQRQQRARHRGNPQNWEPLIDSDKTRRGNRLFCPTPGRSDGHDVSAEQPWLRSGARWGLRCRALRHRVDV